LAISYLSKNSKFGIGDLCAKLNANVSTREETMDNWLDELARSLGEEPLTSTETARLLDAARDVAHRVERKMTPLSAFVMGCAVGRKIADGADRCGATDEVLNQLEAALPPEAPES
jgi:hypothetical protein